VVVVCLAAALTGNVILDAGGYLGKYSLGFLMPAFLLVTGLYMLREMIHSRNGCEGCCGHGCGSKAKGTLADSAPAVGGFLYGLTPCAPLIILAGYALTMNFGQAMILAVLFSLASALSPLLFMVLFMKLVVTKMQDDVPKLVEILRWILSILVLILGAYLLVRYLVGSPVAIAA
jgi:sulfite exporter TauE/SafE